ncbi:MAG: outer membrane protein [Gammaproteobacteria bacterium]
MKTVFKILPIASLGVALSAQAQTQEPSPPEGKEFGYWSAQLGAHNLKRWPATVDFGGPTVDASLELKRGIEFGIAAGKQKDKMRYELEYQHGRIGITRAQVAELGEAVSAKGSYDVVTANVARRLPVNDALSLYATLGAGVARTKLPSLTLSSGCKCVADADKTGFAWQARVGAEQRLSEKGFGFVQAGWLSLPAPRGGAISYARRGTAVLSIGYRGLY